MAQVPKTSSSKRRGPKPAAYQNHIERNDGTVIVCYQTTAGPDDLVFALFNVDDLDIARGCCPVWYPADGYYHIVLARGESPGITVYAHELVIERMIGRPLAAGYTEVVDHINSDPRDNRRANLRVLSHRLNIALRTDVKAGERLPGASFNTVLRRWRVFWRAPGQPPRQLGYFATEYESFLAWQTRLERLQPGASIAFAAHPALLERIDRLAAAARD